MILATMIAMREVKLMKTKKRRRKSEALRKNKAQNGVFDYNQIHIRLDKDDIPLFS